MLKEKNATTVRNADTATGLFGKENYMWMIAGVVVIIIGFLLMAGGKSSDPKIFNDNDVYSTRRITIAPLLIIIGFVMEIVGIMKKTKNTNG